MDAEQFIQILRDKMEAQLTTVTDWNWDQVMRAFDKATVIALIEYAKANGLSID